MRLVVLGAGGRTGRRVVEAAAAAGHGVVAVARGEPALPGGVRLLRGDVMSVAGGDVVTEAAAGAAAVVSCLGVTRSGTGRPSAAAARRLVEVLEPGARVVSVAGAGIDVPGDRKGRGARIVSALTRRLAAEVFADKQEEHDVLAASALAYTVVRPPRLVEGPAQGDAVLTTEAPGLSARPLPRADLAAAMVLLAVEGGWERQAPFIVRPR
jgi:putative NADH-flavin reductase